MGATPDIIRRTLEEPLFEIANNAGFEGRRASAFIKVRSLDCYAAILKRHSKLN